MKPGNSEVPRSYAGWLPLLDRFRDGDDSALDLMRQGSIEWSSIVAERWTVQVSSALERRLMMLSKQLQLWLDRSRGESFAVAGALLNGRRSLDRLRDFASIPCVPDSIKNHLRSEIDRWASETQKVLEENAAKIRTDNGRMLKTFRDNPLTVSLPIEGTKERTPDARSLQRGRRVIF
jgi:hypothetical protein